MWAKVRADIAFLKNIKRLTYRRKRTQRLRQLSDFQILRRFRLNFLTHAEKVEEETFDFPKPSRIIKPSDGNKATLTELTKKIKG